MSHDELNREESSKEKFDEMWETLRGAIPAMPREELRRDLWPDMLRRMKRPQVRVPWFDWALLGVAGAAAIFFPALIPALLYHL